jgi:hypothetical protein
MEEDAMDEPVRTRQFGTAKSLGAEIAILGLWMLVSPIVLGYPATPRAALPAYLLGGLIAAAGGYYQLRPGAARTVGGIVACLGLLSMAAPWLSGAQSLPVLVANDVVIGLAVTWFGIASILAAPGSHAAAPGSV